MEKRTINKRDLGRLYYRYSSKARYYGLDLGMCELTRSHKRLCVEIYINSDIRDLVGWQNVDKRIIH